MTETTKKTRTFRLTNSFHRSETRVRVPTEAVEDVDDFGAKFARVRLSNRQYRSADNALCGITECKCGGIRRDQSCEPTSGDFERCDYTVSVPANYEE
jgi:hypothetical protein